MPRQTTLFLASSSELKAERAAIEALIYRLCKLWQADGIFLRLEVWEDFIDSMSRTRKQDDYNVAVRTADLFVILVNSKLGMYSAEEFDVAHRQFQATGRPLVYTWIKSPPSPGAPDPGPDYGTVRAFLAKLMALGHFPTRFDNAHDLQLQLQLLLQLLKLRADGALGGDGEAAPGPAPTGGWHAQVSGSGALAQGPGAVAASAGSVAIGGNNSAPISVGPRTEISTGGGAYFAGPVSVSGGNLIGRDQVQHGTPPAEQYEVDGRHLRRTARLGQPAGGLREGLAWQTLARQHRGLRTPRVRPPAGTAGHVHAPGRPWHKGRNSSSSRRFELLAWLLPQAEKFPKAQRFAEAAYCPLRPWKHSS